MIGFVCGLAIESSLAGLTNEQEAATFPESTNDTRHGLFNWLDSRSEYGQGVFPEPFLVDDSDLEPGEFRLDWLHTQADGAKNNVVKGEVEYAIGLMTLELEVPYEHDTASGETTEGFDNINLSARYPLYQSVSQSGLVDSTFGAAIEVGIPTGSEVSKNAELVVPKVFNDLKVGDFTLQSVLGYSTLFGPGEEGGLQTFEYGFVFGYTIGHEQLKILCVQEIIPVFELRGETELNKDNPDHNSLLGNAAIRFNLKSIGRVQPRPGIGFVFPIDSGAREETHWGVITSLVFQF
jgi:hypothetical protein